MKTTRLLIAALALAVAAACNADITAPSQDAGQTQPNYGQLGSGKG